MQSTLPSNRAPIPPRLDSKIAAACPPLRQLSTDLLAELLVWAKDAALDYAKCQGKHGNAVGAYDDARAAAIKANGADPELDE